MLTPQRCQARADECRRYANSAIDPKVRAKWLVMAKAWERTASEAAAQETLTENVAEFGEDAADDEPIKGA